MRRYVFALFFSLLINNSAFSQSPAATSPKEQKLSSPQTQQEQNSTTPAQLLDVARLVLESNRDQASATAGQIERASLLIIAFFSIIGLGGGALGWYKLKDMQKAADEAIKAFTSDLDAFRKGAASLSAEFEQSLDSSMKELRAETNTRIELLTARAEIAMAERESDAKEKGVGFTSAIGRIEKALQTPYLPQTTKIKALADLAYAKKRYGDTAGAYEKVAEAADIAKQVAPNMRPLLAYNAACYAVLLGRAEAPIWLTEAIAGGENFRHSACTDEDFKKVHGERWFIELIKVS